jgi:hypothetical protein
MKNICILLRPRVGSTYVNSIDHGYCHNKQQPLSISWWAWNSFSVDSSWKILPQEWSFMKRREKKVNKERVYLYVGTFDFWLVINRKYLQIEVAPFQLYYQFVRSEKYTLNFQGAASFHCSLSVMLFALFAAGEQAGAVGLEHSFLAGV